MSFKNYIQETNVKLIIESINPVITKQDFLDAVSSYSDLDTALEHLPDEYIEFYIKNINSDYIKESENNENYEVYKTRTTGMAPVSGKYKKVNYKGEYIIFLYDQKTGWVPQISFRSISKATKFIKKIADEFM